MTLATEKTWLFTSQVYPYRDNANDTSRYMVWGIKETLKTMGWTVEGGYSYLTAPANNNNQTDPWPAYTDYSRSGTDLWVHMKAPATFGGGNMEIVFGVTYSSSNAYLSRFGITVSHSAGFGSANGGADGSTSAFPTATDQDQLNDEASSTAQWVEGYTRSIYGMWSSDGKNFRIVCKNARVIDSFWSFETLNNAPASLLNDTVCSIRNVAQVADPAQSVMEGDYYTSAYYRGSISGSNRSLYLGTLGYANAGMYAHNDVYEDGKMMLTACDVYHNTTGEKGYMGTIPDMYYGNDQQYGVLLGDTVGGPANWFSGGAIVTPWDPEEPLPRNW